MYNECNSLTSWHQITSDILLKSIDQELLLLELVKFDFYGIRQLILSTKMVKWFLSFYHFYFTCTQANFSYLAPLFREHY